MTKQKKFKKRVRARMAETGEPYTKAHVAEEQERYSVEATIKRLLEERTVWGLPGVLTVLMEFHEYHLQNQAGLTALASEVLEILWPRTPLGDVELSGTLGLPAEEIDPTKDIGTQLRSVLTRWKDGETLEGAKVMPPRTKFPPAVNHPPPVGIDGEHGSAVVENEGFHDDAFFHHDQECEDFGPQIKEMGFGSEEEALDSLWEYGPDVTEIFDGSSEYVNPELIRRVVNELRMGAMLRRPARVYTPEPTISKVPNVAPSGSETPGSPDDDVRGFLRDMAGEVRRLREKLVEAGIDPDGG